MIKQYRKWSVVRDAALSLAAVFAFVLAAPAVLADDDDDEDDRGCLKAAVTDLGSGAFGNAKLCVRDNGLKGTMRVKGWEPADAYTVWWVYIESGVCTAEPPTFGDCVFTFFGDGPEDFPDFSASCPIEIQEDDPPLAVFGRMDSGVVGHAGKLRFANFLNDMQVNPGSQVWLLAFGHGPAVDSGLGLARQLLTPEDPTTGFPHLGVCPPFGGVGLPAAVAIFEMP